ncbi:MAG: hypothetical protein LC799_33000, partial [Actinobacteria bacterium]|nr:hypothetical protein [Actinomycetota bacterium]
AVLAEKNTGEPGAGITGTPGSEGGRRKRTQPRVPRRRPTLLAQVVRTPPDREVCEMQSAETVLGVLRETITQ